MDSVLSSLYSDRTGYRLDAMVNGKLEACEKRGPRQKYYYDLTFENIILAEKKIYVLTHKQNHELQRGRQRS